MRRRQRSKISVWLLVCTVILLPLAIYGKQAGGYVEGIFGRTAKAASVALNGNNRLTAPQWVGLMLTSETTTIAKELSNKGEGLSIEVGKIQNEVASTVNTYKGGERSKILIYHTHTNEAYEQSTPVYAETGEWRTDDQNFNIVRVGEVLSGELEQSGFSIIHDKTNHAPPKLTTAYSRSLVTMLKYKDDNIDYYIDVHRDAYFENLDGNYTIMIDGRATAKIGLVVGKAENEMYSEKPDFDKTYMLAKSVEKELNKLVPGICKPVIVRTERFNQQVSPGCMLVEIGHNKNTIYEAEAASEIFAKALAAVLK